jgi:hypothetical protein
MFDYRKVAIAARLSSIFGIWPTLVIFTTPIITYQEPVGSICSLQFLVAHYLLGPSSISRVTLRWKNTQTLPESFQTFKIQFREFPSSHTTSYSGSNRIFNHRSSCKINIQICWFHATFMQVASNCPPFVNILKPGKKRAGLRCSCFAILAARLIAVLAELAAHHWEYLMGLITYITTRYILYI